MLIYIYIYISFVKNSLKSNVCFNLCSAKNCFCILDPALKLVPNAIKPMSGKNTVEINIHWLNIRLPDSFHSLFYECPIRIT